MLGLDLNIVCGAPVLLLGKFLQKRATLDSRVYGARRRPRTVTKPMNGAIVNIDIRKTDM